MLDGLKNDVKELTETQHQATHTIAAMKAAEEDLRRPAPVLVLEPGDVGLGNRKATAVGRRRAAAPTPLTGNSSTTSRSISQPGHHRRFRQC